MQRPLAIVLTLVASAAAAQPYERAQVETGEQVYRDYCSTCHGFELKNTGGVTFDLRRLKPADHDRFVNSVLNGKNQMPPWRGVLDLVQIEAIWAYIRTEVDR